MISKYEFFQSIFTTYEFVVVVIKFSKNDQLLFNIPIKSKKTKLNKKNYKPQ